VDGFNVNGFVDQLASTRAKYLLFTIGQNSGHYCAPNATYDRIVGITPSKCSRRDLVADLAKALSARNIRLMIYMPNGAPAADPVARQKLRWRWGAPGGWQLPGEPVGGRLVEFQRNWEAVIREWSLRWGKSISGWWIDGCYFADQMYRFDDEPNFASFARALKAGNPESIVAFNPGVKVPVICHTKYDDYTAGEVNLPELSKAVETCSDRWLECGGHKVQFHILSFLGKTWCGGDRPQLPDEQIVAYTRKVAAKGGVITYDVPIQKSGLIPEPFVEQLRAIGAAMVVKPAEPTSKPFVDGTFSWKASGPLILPNRRTADPAISIKDPTIVRDHDRWSPPQLALQADIFEASHTYRLRGSGTYLTIVEAQADQRRYYKAYLADRLEGPWTGLADSRKKPFAAVSNVVQDTAWTTNISHGELLRSGTDETMEVDPTNVQFLFQGASDSEYRGNPYGKIPWRLGLLEMIQHPTSR